MTDCDNFMSTSRSERSAGQPDEEQKEMSTENTEQEKTFQVDREIRSITRSVTLRFAPSL